MLHGRRDVVPPAVVVDNSRALVLLVDGRRDAFVLVLLGISLTSSQEKEEEGEVKHISTSVRRLHRLLTL